MFRLFSVIAAIVTIVVGSVTTGAWAYSVEPEQFRVWATSCAHVPADIAKGRESMGLAIRQSEGRVPGTPGFAWDILVDAGDLSAHQYPPGDQDGLELIRQYRTMIDHRREQIYNVPGNHDASYFDQGVGSWFQKWGDPLGQHTQFSGVDPQRRPFAVEGSWERYRFQAGNILFLMLADRNDAPPPVGRGDSRAALRGGFPAGAVTRETFDWWKRQVLDNQDKIIVTVHHHVLRDTTVASGRGEGSPRYHGSSGDADGASYLYYIIENDDPEDFRYTSDAHVFEDFLDDFFQQHGHGAIDLWVGGHTHVQGPDDNWGGKTITESRWGVGFLQVAALTKHHAGSHPMSRLLTFTQGESRVQTGLYLHDDQFNQQPVGWYPPAAKMLPLRHPCVVPDPIQTLSPFPEMSQVSEVESDEGTVQVITERDVPVPMRDGVVLRANIFRPAHGGPYPVLLMRTPYGKPAKVDERYIQAGYIVVTQDARGRYASEGSPESFVRFATHDAEDGYDTVQWAAQIAGANGRVGTFGASYNAFLQWRLAALRPPALAAMAAFSIPARYPDLEGPGTIRPGRRLNWWITGISPDMRKHSGREGTHTSVEARELWNAGEADVWLNFLPWLELPRSVFEDDTEAVHYWLLNPHEDPWKLQEDARMVEVPNLNLVGWHDHCNGNLLLDRTIMASAATEAARLGSRTWIGPWAHSKNRRYGNIDFGREAAVDVVALEIRWFDYWLKGKQNGMEATSPWRIFVMGDNQWRDEPEWPLKRAQPRELFITSAGSANTPSGDGRLVWEHPTVENKDHFVYDPANPVPSLHGRGLQARTSDQRPLADRQDILVYQSEPLVERFEVTGNPLVELYARSSAPDTDFFVRLIDVSPDGLARDVSLGMVRARYRQGLDKPALLEPEAVVKYRIEMNPTSNAFLPGHRIRLDITSSDFPNYDRNHNTAANQNADSELSMAEQTVFHGDSQATRIVLPWVPTQLEP